MIPSTPTEKCQPAKRTNNQTEGRHHGWNDKIIVSENNTNQSNTCHWWGTTYCLRKKRIQIPVWRLQLNCLRVGSASVDPTFFNGFEPFTCGQTKRGTIIQVFRNTLRNFVETRPSAARALQFGSWIAEWFEKKTCLLCCQRDGDQLWGGENGVKTLKVCYFGTLFESCQWPTQ